MKAPHIAVRTVLITGCSSGIGRATADLLRGRGWTVWPTARTGKDLADLRAAGFEPVELDLADSESVQRAAAEVVRRGAAGLGGLVNNAGFGQPGAVEDVSREAMRRQFEVNVFGLQELTNALAPVFRRQGYGRIVNVSSVLGRIVIPFMGVYAASKFAVEALSDALRVELRGSGVAVSLVEPGPIETAFRRNAFERGCETLDPDRARFASVYESEGRRRIEREFRSSDPFTAPPEAVARVILHALESRRPRRRYPVTLPARAGVLLARWLPAAWVDGLLARRMPKAR